MQSTVPHSSTEARLLALIHLHPARGRVPGLPEAADRVLFARVAGAEGRSDADVLARVEAAWQAAGAAWTADRFPLVGLWVYDGWLAPGISRAGAGGVGGPSEVWRWGRWRHPVLSELSRLESGTPLWQPADLDRVTR